MLARRMGSKNMSANFIISDSVRAGTIARPLEPFVITDAFMEKAHNWMRQFVSDDVPKLLTSPADKKFQETIAREILTGYREAMDRDPHDGQALPANVVDFKQRLSNGFMQIHKALEAHSVPAALISKITTAYAEKVTLPLCAQIQKNAADHHRVPDDMGGPG